MIFIGYTKKLGLVDVEAVRDFVKKKGVEGVELYCEEEPAEKVKASVVDFSIHVVSNSKKAAKMRAKELKKKGEKVYLVDLREFGEKAIRDVV